MSRDDVTVDQQSSTKAVSHPLNDETIAKHPSGTVSEAPSMPMFAPPAEACEIGRLGKYRIQKELGRGGMGAVFLAFDERLQRKVALKVMLPKAAENVTARERFLREARAAAQISSDHVVNIFEADEIDGIPYIALQFLQGSPLDEYLKKKGNPSIPQVIRVGIETAKGLAAAHKLGIVHRDIKPGNLWLEAPGGRVKILDFGLAKPVVGSDTAELTGSGSVLGTPAYMAPEQGMGKPVDGRSDLFSLGCVLYRLCSGKLPFERPTMMGILAAAVIAEEPSPVREANPAVPESLAALIGRLLAKNPDNRPATAMAVARELEQILAAAKQELAVPKETAVAKPAPEITRPSEPFADFDEPTESVNALRSQPPTAAKRSRKQLFIAAGILTTTILVTLAVLVLRVETPEGTLLVELNGPDVEARIKDGKLVLVGPDGKDRYTITPGERNKKIDAGAYTVPVEGADGLALDTREFTLKKGGQVTVRVTPEPKAVAKKDTGSGSPLQLPPKQIPATYKNSLGMEFVKVPKGTSWLGGGGGKPGETKVVIEQDFYLGKYEVTQEEWEAVTGQNPSHICRNGGGKNAVKDIPDADLKRFPVENVSWDDCQFFLNRLNEKEKESGWVYRLPKALEWEYACRGGPVDKTDTAFDFYFAKPTSKSLPTQANFAPEAGQGLQRSTKVGSYESNSLGLFDMHGNVWEWCTDEVEPHPQQTERGIRRVDRGGGWNYGPTECRANARSAYWPAMRDIAIGLRVVRVPVGLVVPAPAMTDPDRNAAQYVISVGGAVFINNQQPPITSTQMLPKESFRLTGIILKENQKVTDAGLACFKNFKGLTHIDLFHASKITDEGLAIFSGCKNLRLLNLGWTAVTDKGLAHFAGCKNLELLDLYLTATTDEGLKNFNSCSELTLISLGNTKVTDAGLAEFKNCKKMAHLHLFLSTEVTNAGLQHFERCNEMLSLNLSGTKIDDAGLTVLKNHPKIDQLHLQSDLFGDKGLVHLQGLSNLTYVNLLKSKVTAKGIDGLRKSSSELQNRMGRGRHRADEEVNDLAIGKCSRSSSTQQSISEVKESVMGAVFCRKDGKVEKYFTSVFDLCKLK